MPSPTFLQVPYRWHQRQVVKFGGKPIPVVGGNLPFIDLNDRVAWFAVEGPKIDNTHVSNKASQIAFRGKGLWTSADFIGRKIRLPIYYDETSGVPFSQAKAYLTQTGEQYLTFDNVTGLPVKCNSFSESDFLTDAPDAPGQYTHKAVLEFLSRNAFAEDMTTLSSNPGSVGLTPLNWNISYGGLVFAEPIYTFTLNPANSGTLTNITISNQSSGESMNVVMPPNFHGGHTNVITIDSGAQTILIDATPVAPSGSFPHLYPGFPPPLNNAMSAVLTGTGSWSATLTVTYTTRWEI